MRSSFAKNFPTPIAALRICPYTGTAVSVDSPTSSPTSAKLSSALPELVDGAKVTFAKIPLTAPRLPMLATFGNQSKRIPPARFDVARSNMLRRCARVHAFDCRAEVTPSSSAPGNALMLSSRPPKMPDRFASLLGNGELKSASGFAPIRGSFLASTGTTRVPSG